MEYLAGLSPRVGRCGDDARSTASIPESCFLVSQKNLRMLNFDLSRIVVVHRGHQVNKHGMRQHMIFAEARSDHRML